MRLALYRHGAVVGFISITDSADVCGVMSQVALQSLATALHSGSTPITGQAAGRQMLEKNPGVFMNPQQPLVQVLSGFKSSAGRRDSFRVADG